jgi:hypothetical protein
MGPNPNAQISKFTFLGRNPKNLGFIIIWVDSSYGSTLIFQNNSHFEKVLIFYLIFHILEKPHFVEFLVLMPSSQKSRCKLEV